LDQLGRRKEAAAELATLAVHLATEGDPDAAGVAERALSLDPGSAAAAEVLGRRSGGTAPAAVPVAVRGDVTEEIEQVDFFLEQSLVDEARSVLDELEQRFPGHPKLAAKRSVIDALDKPLPGAIPGGGEDTTHLAPIAKLSTSESADPGTHGDLGIAYKQMGLLDAAIAEFRQVVADPSRAVFALTMMGECFEAQGQLGDAVARYKEALNLPQATQTESHELYYLLGSVFERLGDKREALYFFENLRKRNPRFRDVERRVESLKPTTAQRA
jgi:tetratricopeptide (TPR) repeat protein